MSPDGKWLAYASTISGTNEAYVLPYPGDGPSVLVSSRGGTEPRWSHDGAELVYRSGSRIMSLSRARSTSGAFGPPQALFSGAFDFSQERNWSLGPDGSFVMIKADPTMGPQLRVVFRWFDELTAASRAKQGGDVIRRFRARNLRRRNSADDSVQSIQRQITNFFKEPR